uniref:Uncharacterized protein n=1 Tax=Glossina austeni TaxID=7395 RepID=A0A1A9UU48_GLOAU
MKADRNAVSFQAQLELKISSQPKEFQSPLKFLQGILISNSERIQLSAHMQFHIELKQFSINCIEFINGAKVFALQTEIILLRCEPKSDNVLVAHCRLRVDSDFSCSRSLNCSLLLLTTGDMKSFWIDYVSVKFRDYSSVFWVRL